jgi:hypothetical protein
MRSRRNHLHVPRIPMTHLPHNCHDEIQFGVQDSKSLLGFHLKNINRTPKVGAFRNSLWSSCMIPHAFLLTI